MKRGGPDREAGSATIFVIGFTVILLAMAGLVVDGGLALNARQRAADDVEQAARAGSQHLDMQLLRDKGVVQIDQTGAAADAATAFLQSRGGYYNIQVSADGNQLQVKATTTQRTTLLSLIFIKDFTITATGQARPAVGNAAP